MLIVHKYGGSSVATSQQIMAIAKRLKEIKEQGNDLVVVASAMGKTTNNLISLAHEISKSPVLNELDSLMSTGEIQTVSLLSIALNEIGVKAISLSGKQAGILTTNNFSRAFIKEINTAKILKLLSAGYVVIVAGFQGANKSDQTTTLGRGGSDTTAVALAAALNCQCEIYTDVPGVFSVDPRIYPNAKQLESVNYDEMMEMALNGAKVLETRSVELAKIYNVKLYLGKTLEKEKQGTFIMKKRLFEEMKINSLALKNDFLLVDFEISPDQQVGLLKILSESCQNFEMFNQYKINNKNHISISISKPHYITLSNIFRESKIKNIKSTIKKDLSRISLIGSGLATHKFFITKTFEILQQRKIETFNTILSENAISITINEKDKEVAVEALSKAFNL